MSFFVICGALGPGGCREAAVFGGGLGGWSPSGRVEGKGFIYMFMKNSTAGHAKEVIQHGVNNGMDAWRKLFRDQFPLAEDKRNIIMTEFMRLKELANASGLRHLTLEIERITDNWERLPLPERHLGPTWVTWAHLGPLRPLQ